jgi:hypothetical protein
MAQIVMVFCRIRINKLNPFKAGVSLRKSAKAHCDSAHQVVKEPLFWKFAQQACAGFGCRDQGLGIVKLCYVLNLVFWRLLREGVFKAELVLNRFRALARGCVFGKSVQNILVKPRRTGKIVLFFLFCSKP